MFCEKCGAKISDDAMFCKKCGAPVEPEVTENQEKQDYQEKSPVEMQPAESEVVTEQLNPSMRPMEQEAVEKQIEVEKPKKKKSKLPLIILLTVLILVVIAGGVFIFFNTGSRKINREMAKAESYLDNKHYEFAVKQYEKVIKLDDEYVDAYLGVAETYEKWSKKAAKDEDNEQVLENYENAIEVLEKGLDNTDDKKIRQKLEKLEGLYKKAGGKDEKTKKSGEKSKAKSKIEDDNIDALAAYQSFIGAKQGRVNVKAQLSPNYADYANMKRYLTYGNRIGFEELTSTMEKLNRGEYGSSKGVDTEYSIITSASDNNKYLILKYTDSAVATNITYVVCYYTGIDIEIIYASTNDCLDNEDIYSDGLIVGTATFDEVFYDWGKVLYEGKAIDIYDCATCDPFLASDVDPEAFEAYQNAGNESFFLIEKYEIDGKKYTSWQPTEAIDYTDADPYGEYSTGTVDWSTHQEMVDLVDKRFAEYGVDFDRKNEIEFQPIVETL